MIVAIVTVKMSQVMYPHLDIHFLQYSTGMLSNADFIISVKLFAA